MKIDIKKLLLFILLNIFNITYLNVAYCSNLKEVERYLDRYNKTIGINANILISKDNKEVFVKSYGYNDIVKKTPLKRNNQFSAGSITKQFIAAAVLKLAQENNFKLTDKISDHLDIIKKSPWAKDVTIEHLLTHTSGIYDLRPFEYDRNPEISSLNAVASYLKSKPSISKPGKVFSYSNNGYLILGLLVEKYGELPLADYLQGMFFIPLGMKNTSLQSWHRPLYFLKNDKTLNLAIPHFYKNNGNIESLKNTESTVEVSAAGGLVTTVDDLRLWNHGLYNGIILSYEMIEELTKPRENSYGLGVYVEKLANGEISYSHGGSIDGYQAELIYLPKHRITISILSNVQYPSPHRMESLKDSLTMLVLNSKL